jgi:hypothetical protein
MSNWLDLVKKVSRANPGKTLKAILPMASKQWKKMKKSGTMKVGSNKPKRSMRRSSSKKRRSSSRR